MSKGYRSSDYRLTPTGVYFICENKARQAVYDDCEALAKENICMFGDYRVMQEGAKYNGVWLETQPMGGEMYATRDMEVALNNQLIFMYYQHRNGKMPGMIRCSLPWNGITPHYDWMQGDFFTKSALRMYWFLGEDRDYLRLLYTAIRDFDEYLWSCRDSDGNGCLEAWCVWDTGEDNCTKLLSTGVKYPEWGSHTGETAPAYGVGFPIESGEYMAYSYAHRTALAEISDILGNGEGDLWRARARAVQDRVREYLWREDKKALYDRDCNNVFIDCLTLENLKCMYHGLFTQEMADAFIRSHLLNPAEFATPLPLCYIAVNDPLFYLSDECNNFTPENKAKKLLHTDAADNCWSGPVEGLTVQRSLDALLNYGYHAEASTVGRRWLDNLAACRRYVQGYDPRTGAPSPGMQGYGPTVLSALEYMTYLYGVDFVKGELIFSCSAEHFASEYTQTLFGHAYTLSRKNGEAVISMDGETVFSASLGVRIVTDLACRPKTVTCMEQTDTDFYITMGETVYRKRLAPNTTLCL